MIPERLRLIAATYHASLPTGVPAGACRDMLSAGAAILRAEPLTRNTTLDLRVDGCQHILVVGFGLTGGALASSR